MEHRINKDLTDYPDDFDHESYQRWLDERDKNIKQPEPEENNDNK